MRRAVCSCPCLGHNAQCEAFRTTEIREAALLKHSCATDFGALVANSLSATQFESLARIHAAMAASEGPHLDGFYNGQAELERVPAPKRAPFSVDGVFRSDALCFEVNPVTWLCLAQHGITVRGRPAQALAIAADPASLQSFEIDNLRPTESRGSRRAAGPSLVRGQRKICS